MKTQSIKIPFGYQIQKHNETIDIVKAERILSGKKQHKYTYATRCGLQATLVKHIWICPYCNAHIPAYSRYFQRNMISEKKSKNEIADWATLQLSLFKEPNKSLFFNYPVKNGALKCPVCGKISERKMKTRELTFRCKKRSLEITTEIDGMDEIFFLNWMSAGWLNLMFPLYETIVFNFANGHTFLKLHTGNGIEYTVSDITKKPQSWNDGPLYEFLNNRKLAARTLKRFFAEQFGESLPYNNIELTTDKYVLMCRFIGYPRQFYDAIPFSSNTYSIDPSFAKIAKRLHKKQNALLVYHESTLPKSKAIKKALFEDPGLLFYLHECESLWSLLNDVNLMRELLNSPAVYDIMSEYHLYPGVFEYYKDYVKVKGSRSLLKCLTEDPKKVNSEARRYASLNQNAKKQEQINWKRARKIRHRFEDEDEEFEEYFQPPYFFSTPLAKVDRQITPCIIDDFIFLWLTNSADYYETGRTLHNCLRSWKRRYNPVVVVKENNRAVAAIEVSVSDHMIIQAKTAHNEPIKEGSKLAMALEKWKKKYVLNEMPEGAYEGDDEIIRILEALPF